MAGPVTTTWVKGAEGRRAPAPRRGRRVLPPPPLNACKSNAPSPGAMRAQNLPRAACGLDPIEWQLGGAQPYPPALPPLSAVQRSGATMGSVLRSGKRLAAEPSSPETPHSSSEPRSGLRCCPLLTLPSELLELAALQSGGYKELCSLSQTNTVLRELSQVRPQCSHVIRSRLPCPAAACKQVAYPASARGLALHGPAPLQLAHTRQHWVSGAVPGALRTPALPPPPRRCRRRLRLPARRRPMPPALPTRLASTCCPTVLPWIRRTAACGALSGSACMGRRGACRKRQPSERGWVLAVAAGMAADPLCTLELAPQAVSACDLAPHDRSLSMCCFAGGWRLEGAACILQIQRLAETVLPCTCCAGAPAAGRRCLLAATPRCARQTRGSSPRRTKCRLQVRMAARGAAGGGMPESIVAPPSALLLLFQGPASFKLRMLPPPRCSRHAGGAAHAMPGQRLK